MQLSASFDQRSPQRLAVASAGATAESICASRCARGVIVPLCSPILKADLPASVRIAWPGSYMPALIRMTQPSVRSRPATAATRWSLMPFWKSTTTPSGLRYATPMAVAHSVSYDFTATKTASKGSATCCSSWMWSARTGTT